MKLGTIRVIALAALLLPLAMSEDARFIALWQVGFTSRVYTYI